MKQDEELSLLSKLIADYNFVQWSIMLAIQFIAICTYTLRHCMCLKFQHHCKIPVLCVLLFTGHNTHFCRVIWLFIHKWHSYADSRLIGKFTIRLYYNVYNGMGLAYNTAETTLSIQQL